ncbi:hypothetical protein KIO76_12870 [Chelatococcus sp. YT9]|nr:hypothetical protein [Chelatococcus sp. YT9]
MSFSRLMLAALLPLAGCAPAAAPSIPLFGAYFPAWLACAVAGILGAVILRVVFIQIGVDDVLPWRLLVYVCLALAIAFAFSRFVFGR